MVTTEMVRKTLSQTKLRGIRTNAHSSMSSRFRTNDRQMRYKRLRHNMFTDTMMASVPSRSRDLYAQVFVTGFKWARAYPMQKKSDAVHALDLLLHREGAPQKMIMDGSKEQTFIKFRKTCQDVQIHVK